MDERTVGVAHQLYGARKTLRGLLGDVKFQEKVQDYIDIVKGCMAKHSCTEIEALMIMLKDPMVHGVTSLWLQAAMVEMLEPTKP